LRGHRPRLSVIVPVHDGRKVLPLCLSSLVQSDLPREQWELIVVDDGSTDDTALIAARYADKVVRLPGKTHGPAYSRNRGFETSTGEIVVFVDADVSVHADTLRRFLALHDAEPDVTAIFGAYDGRSGQQGFVSDFRNLLHHYVRHREAGEAERFWAGCGSIRAAAFREVGMFDEWHYSQPQVEDIELGRRLRRNGHRILLRPEIQGTHLKEWTLRDSIISDFKRRGVPWMRLRLQESAIARGRLRDLRTSEKLCTAAAGLGWFAIGLAALLGALWPLGYLPAGMLSIVLINRQFYRLALRQRGVLGALGMFPLHMIYYATNVVSAVMGWLLHNLLGEPLAPIDATAEAGMDLRTWPPVRSRPSAGVWTDSPRRREAESTKPASAPAGS